MDEEQMTVFGTVIDKDDSPQWVIELTETNPVSYWAGEEDSFDYDKSRARRFASEEAAEEALRTRVLTRLRAFCRVVEQ